MICVDLQRLPEEAGSLLIRRPAVQAWHRGVSGACLERVPFHCYKPPTFVRMGSYIGKLSSDGTLMEEARCPPKADKSPSLKAITERGIIITSENDCCCRYLSFACSRLHFRRAAVQDLLVSPQASQSGLAAAWRGELWQVQRWSVLVRERLHSIVSFHTLGCAFVCQGWEGIGFHAFSGLGWVWQCTRLSQHCTAHRFPRSPCAGLM